MLGERDYAKYPFTIEAIEFVRGLKIELKDLVSPDYSRIVERAKERVREAVERSSISYDGKDVRVEIPSFPVALMFVAALKSGFLARRYALAESKRAYGLLRYEDERKILDVARTFKWSLQTVDDPTYDFRLRLFDYLRNIELLREDRWKLVNRVVGNGWVYLTRGEVARLLSEEVRRYVAGRILRSEGVRLPEEFEQALEELRGM
ncbi:TPA: hypothetical protein EYP44_04870, partial [Candidatus Bathyarchaeota archaeon]|nr:hypothetical protein [Candidatus Bathyarchaeota archaeon]